MSWSHGTKSAVKEPMDGGQLPMLDDKWRSGTSKNNRIYS